MTPTMLAKRTSRNEVTLPKAVVQAVGESEYYEVTAERGRIVLTPVRVQHAARLREARASIERTFES